MPSWHTPEPHVLQEVTGELSHEDWQRKYYECYVKYTRKNGDINTGILHDVVIDLEKDTDKVYYSLVGLNGTNPVRIPHDRVEFSTPEFGMMEVGGELVYVDRLVQRQWKVVLHPKWMHVTNFIKSHPPPLSPVAHQMLTNSYRPVVNSISMLRTGAVKGVALNKDWGMILSDIYPEIMLVYKQFIVGHVTEQYNFLYTYARVLEPELEEVLKEPVVIIQTPEQCGCPRT